MALLVAAIGLLAPGSLAASQAAPGSWKQQSPLPTGFELNAVDMISASEGWAVGDAGTILHTSDGGQSWEHQPSGTTEPIYTVSFKDSLHGWAGSNNTVVFTTDGGANWARGQGILGGIIGVGFADTQTGFATWGGSGMFKSTNGGATWTQVPSPISVARVQFFDSLNGVISGPGGALHTTNGGATFQQVPGPHGGFFLNHRLGWDAHEDETSFTRDGGRTWRPASLPSSQWIYSGAVFTDPLNGWAAGEAQGIVHTTDGGRTWATSNGGIGSGPDNRYRLWGIDATDALHAVAVGESGVILSTADGGDTWVSRQSGGGITYDLAAVDSQHAWSAQAFGEIMVTEDGGDTWVRHSVGNPFGHFWGIDFATESRGWAVGDADQSLNYGMIYGSNDGGHTWQLQWTGSDLTVLYDVKGVTNNVAVAVGNLGVILRTTDGGQTWQPVSHPPATVLSGVDFVGATGYAVGNGNAVLRTTNAGASWTDVRPSLPFDSSLQDASFVNANTGWVVGYYGVVLRTSNGGGSWVERGFGSSSGINVLSVQALGPNTAVIAGYDNGRGFVSATNDGGRTWVRQSLPAEEPPIYSVSDVEFLPDGTGWAGGHVGIWRFDPSG